MFLRLANIRFHGIRPWDGVWSTGYLLGSNTCGKEERKQDWMEGETELHCRPNKALGALELTWPIGIVPHGLRCPKDLLFTLLQWPVTGYGLPREGCVLGKATLCSWSTPWSHWLSTDHTASLCSNTSFFERHLGHASRVHYRGPPSAYLPSV